MCQLCDKPIHARQLCHTHYVRAWRIGFPPKPTHCECGTKIYARGMCQKHYMRKYRAGLPVKAKPATLTLKTEPTNLSYWEFVKKELAL